MRIGKDHFIRQIQDLEAQLEQAHLEQAYAALAELIKSVNECGRDHDLPPLSADFGKGWLSPDEAKRLDAELKDAKRLVAYKDELRRVAQWLERLEALKGGQK